MNRALVDRIANAVLYEGYILYPYRPSVKNRQRWTFGGLYPEAYCQRTGSDPSSNQTECLVQGGPATTIEVTGRFLHLTNRQVAELTPPVAEWPHDAEPTFRPVESLRVGDAVFHSWQEAEECAIDLGGIPLSEILDRPARQAFSITGKCWSELLRGPEEEIVGVLVREQKSIDGEIEVRATRLEHELFKLTVRVANRTAYPDAGDGSRDDAMLRSFASTYVVLGVRQGEFVSLLDPPEQWRSAAAGCSNVGVWPVLVGEEGTRDTMLSSPIILYDYPEIAPESPGDLFDGTEIDEILTLRILTLTDEEKRTAAGLDPRARELLSRTENLSREQLYGLHGAMRGRRPMPGGNV